MKTKVAIVTGSSRGIGAAIARRLAKEDLAIVVNYVGGRSEAEKIVGDIEASGGRAIAVKADVADVSAARRLFDEAEAKLGKVDVLVNNAGITPSTYPAIGATDEATFDRLFAVNVKGSFNMMREAANRMNDGGRIVNLSTSAIGLALPGYAAYCATKSAVETLTNIMAKEMRGKHITVNAIAPGPTATDLFFAGKSQEVIDRLTKAAPMERLGTPEDIAAAVSFLVGEGGGWVNGQTVRANGGIV